MGLAIAVLDGIERDLDVVTFDDLDLAALIAELLDGDDGFGLQTHVDDDHVVADADHATGEDLAGPDALVGQALFEQFAERFAHVILVACCWKIPPAARLCGHTGLNRNPLRSPTKKTLRGS